MAAGTFSRKRLPECGRIAVTPVLTLSPLIKVAWPTRTPATSVTALFLPVGRIPTSTPRSRARGRGVWLVVWLIVLKEKSKRQPQKRRSLIFIAFISRSLSDAIEGSGSEHDRKTRRQIESYISPVGFHISAYFR